MKTVTVSIISHKSNNQVDEYKLWAAETDEEHARGLKGIDEMPDGVQGMIFDFGSSAQRIMSMRDCKMPLTFLFINADRQVRQIEAFVEPSEEQPPIVASKMDAQYVIELDRKTSANLKTVLNDTVLIGG